MRVAYFSPMPPEQTGIADYSALLLPALRERIDVDGRPARRAKARLAAPTSRSTTSGTTRTRTRGSSTRSAARPGVVVLHDFVLHHLVAGMTVGRRDGHGYLDLMEREHGVVGRLLGHGVLDKRIPPLWESRPEDFPLATFVLEHATGADRPLALRARSRAGGGVRGPDLRWCRIRPGRLRRVEPERVGAGPWSAASASSTRASGSRSSSGRRRRCGRRTPTLTLLLVGSTSPGFDLDRRLQRLGLADDGARCAKAGSTSDGSGRSWPAATCS